MGMKPRIQIFAAMGAGAALWLVLRRHPVKGPAAVRLAFALAVGVGAWWQEKKRLRELAEHLNEAGYLRSGEA